MVWKTMIRRKWNREKADLQRRVAQAIHKHDNRDESTTNERKRIVYCKHMAKHSSLYDFQSNCEIPGIDMSSSLDDDNKVDHVHVLLLRDPV